MDIFAVQDSGLNIFLIIFRSSRFIKYEKNHLFKKMSMEFNFKAFSGLILIVISIALQLID